MIHFLGGDDWPCGKQTFSVSWSPGLISQQPNLSCFNLVLIFHPKSQCSHRIILKRSPIPPTRQVADSSCQTKPCPRLPRLA